MPELPDITVYLRALSERIEGRTLEQIRLASPFVVRSFDPPIREASGKTVRSLRRLGKRVVLGLDEELWLVIHLMISGRFQWKDRGAKIPGRLGLAAFDFPNGTLLPPRPAPRSAPRFTSCGERRRSRSSTAAESNRWRRPPNSFGRRSSARTTP
jgi:formamidopyrimidine-DNA glycosylase